MRLHLTLAASCGLLLTLHAETYEWLGTADNNWYNAANWSPTAVPDAGDSVTISSGTVTLTNQTAPLAAFTMSGGTLTFSNWTTRLSAATVAINSGTITCAGPFLNSEMSNRVWIACNSFSLGTNGIIDVSGKGYRGGTTGENGHGPGGGEDWQGGTFGGEGGRNPKQIYGMPHMPIAPGSGGGGYPYNATYRGGAAGGAVLLEATDHICLAGTITADGLIGESNCPGGSGGGVMLICKTFAGSGSISANGGNSSRDVSGGGGGGRVAVIFTPTEQAEIPPPHVAISVIGGTHSNPLYPGRRGSLYFPDTQLLKPILNLSGYLFIGQNDIWKTHSLIMSNKVNLTFPATFTLIVENDLTISDKSRLAFGDTFDTPHNGGLLISGNVRIDDGELHYYFAAGAPESFLINGLLIMTNAATISLYAGPTNETCNTVYGGLLDLSGTILDLTAGCVIRPYTHPTNGATIHLRVHDLVIAGGAMIDASAAGFGGGSHLSPNRAGYGPGGGKAHSGGGYGGRGGGSGGGLPYGQPLGPINPGSGGGGYLYGDAFAGNGGGLVHVEATGNIILHGLINANGKTGDANTAGASGGGVLLSCRHFSGSGIIMAEGADTARVSYGDGGGGRVAVWYGAPYTDMTPQHLLVVSETAPLSFVGPAPSVTAGSISTATPPAEPGTIRFVRVLYPLGTLMIVR